MYIIIYPPRLTSLCCILFFLNKPQPSIKTFAEILRDCFKFSALPLRLFGYSFFFFFFLNERCSNEPDSNFYRYSQSLDIPTIRHFLKRHCWQRFLLILMMGQLSFLRHFLYWMFCWMLLLKKPCVFTKTNSAPWWQGSHKSRREGEITVSGHVKIRPTQVLFNFK